MAKAKNPEVEFRDRFASDQAGAVWDALVALHERVSFVEAKIREYHPTEEKLNLLLALLSEREKGK